MSKEYISEYNRPSIFYRIFCDKGDIACGLFVVRFDRYILKAVSQLFFKLLVIVGVDVEQLLRAIFSVFWFDASMYSFLNGGLFLLLYSDIIKQK